MSFRSMMSLGVPVILQADNGKEFKGAVLQLVRGLPWSELKVKSGELAHCMFKV